MPLLEFDSIVWTTKGRGRRKTVILIPTLLLSLLMLWPGCWWLALKSSRALMPPTKNPDIQMDHFRRNRSLQMYLSHIPLLIEPKASQCLKFQKLPVVIMVTSAPSNYENRQAVRRTWARYQPTYFVMGLSGYNMDQQLVDSYIEAAQFDDVIVYGFADHYQNLTLKTALMMKWYQENCRHAKFMFKTDDDVLVNPWALNSVLIKHYNAQLLGYVFKDVPVRRDKYDKWYIPRWMLHDAVVPQYLSGTGYIVNGDHIQAILKEANHVPIINMEDIYFTYLVARKQLGLNLTHEPRLNPYRPLVRVPCVYWYMVSVHSYEPKKMFSAWSNIEELVYANESPEQICALFYRYLFFLII